MFGAIRATPVLPAFPFEFMRNSQPYLQPRPSGARALPLGVFQEGRTSKKTDHLSCPSWKRPRRPPTPAKQMLSSRVPRVAKCRHCAGGEGHSKRLPVTMPHMARLSVARRPRVCERLTNQVIEAVDPRRHETTSPSERAWSRPFAAGRFA